MGKWVAGVMATVLSGVLVYWLTQGIDRDEKNASLLATSTPAVAASSSSTPTLFDIRGAYMLIKVDPVEDSHDLPPNLGITIEPKTGTEGFAKYRLPLKVEGVGDHIAGHEYIALIGSRLRIVLGRNEKTGEVISMWRELHFSDPYLVLSWETPHGKRSWTFRRI